MDLRQRSRDNFNHEDDVTLAGEHESTMSMDPEGGFGVCLASTIGGLGALRLFQAEFVINHLTSPRRPVYILQ